MMLNAQQKIDILKQSSFLGRMPDAMLTEVAATAEEKQFERGHFIFAKNDAADNF